MAMALVVSFTGLLTVNAQEALAAGSAYTNIYNTSNNGDFAWVGSARNFPRRSYERKLCVRVSGPGVDRGRCEGFKGTGASISGRGFCLVGNEYWSTARVFDRRGRVLASDVDNIMCGNYNGPGPAAQDRQGEKVPRSSDR